METDRLHCCYYLHALMAIAASSLSTGYQVTTSKAIWPRPLASANTARPDAGRAAAGESEGVVARPMGESEGAAAGPGAGRAFFRGL